MIRLLVLSDAHKDTPSLLQAIRLHREADAIFFLGDGETDFQSPPVQSACTGKKCTAVAGNCDVYSALPKEILLPLGGKRIFALHGHTQMVKHGMQMLQETAEAKQADLVLYGHTHIPKVEYKNGIYYLCPGSIRQGAYGLVDITDDGSLACWTAVLGEEKNKC